MIRINKREFKIYILGILATLEYYTPYYFSKSSLLIRIILYMSLGLMGIYILNNTKSFSKRLRYLLYYLAVLGISTFLNGESIVEYIKFVVLILMPCICIDTMYRKDRDALMIIAKGIRDVSFIFFLIQMYTCFRYPNGIPSISTTEKMYFFGNINSTIKTVFPGIICASLCRENQNKFPKLVLIYLLGIIVLSIKIYTMATAIVGIIFIYLWERYENRIRPNIKITLYVILLIIILFEVIDVFYGKNTGPISLIMDIFNKSDSLSGRIELWSRSIETIKSKWLYGYGYLTINGFNKVIASPNGAHNFTLDVLICSGAIGLFFFIIYLKNIIKNVLNNVRNNRNIYRIFGYIIALLLMMLTEPFYYSSSFIILNILNINFKSEN